MTATASQLRTESAISNDLRQAEQLLATMKDELSRTDEAIGKLRQEVVDSKIIEESRQQHELRQTGRLPAASHKHTARIKEIDAELLPHSIDRRNKVARALADQARQINSLNTELDAAKRRRIQSHAQTLTEQVELDLLKSAAAYSITMARALGVVPAQTNPAQMASRAIATASAERRFDPHLQAAEQTLEKDSK